MQNDINTFRKRMSVCLSVFLNNILSFCFGVGCPIPRSIPSLTHSLAHSLPSPPLSCLSLSSPLVIPTLLPRLSISFLSLYFYFLALSLSCLSLMSLSSSLSLKTSFSLRHSHPPNTCANLQTAPLITGSLST